MGMLGQNLLQSQGLCMTSCLSVPACRPHCQLSQASRTAPSSLTCGEWLWPMLPLPTATLQWHLPATGPLATQYKATSCFLLLTLPADCCGQHVGCDSRFWQLPGKHLRSYSLRAHTVVLESFDTILGLAVQTCIWSSCAWKILT